MFLKNCSKASKTTIQCVSLLFTFWTILSFSQIVNEADAIVSAYQTFAILPREVAYAHLNKTTYIKGETLAFSAYVFDKGTKKLSNATTNLYCTVSDENGKTIKSELILVNNGVAQGSFFVDSLFSAGNYTFKAYTNWMKNFDTQNFYVESIKVIDPETHTNSVPKVISYKLDAQFLPEGGHLLINAKNTMGVVIKDTLGFGVPFVEGQLLNSKNIIVNAFKTNQFGIGKFEIFPKINETYKVSVDFEGSQQLFDLEPADTLGVNLTLNELNNKVVIRLATNENTLESIANKHYKLAIHNGNEFKTTEITFKKNTEILKLINYNDLFTGINIFTLFDDNNFPLLERLFFKYDGIASIKTGELSFEKDNDSTLISIPFIDVDSSLINKFSISVLPMDTKSYNHHQNIISYLYLQPYVKGFIENAKYYFTDITRKKKYELDNLLLTQGWSSYDWRKIFNHQPKTNYNFENGIDFRANINESKTGKFIVYPISNSGLKIFEVTDTTKTFEMSGIFPSDDETLKLSEVRKNRSVKKTDIYVQFFPSKIPEIEKHIKVLPLKEKVFFESDLSQPLLDTSWNELEQLDEIIISVNKEKERIEKLKNSSWGLVDVFDERKRNSYIDFASYIRTKGFRVDQIDGEIRIYNTRSGVNTVPTIYIDDRLLFGIDELFFYKMDYVDYIIIDKSGMSAEGSRGYGGVIKIYTDPLISKNNPRTSIYQEIEIPLTFTSPTKFYTPKYSYYQSNFYKEYGVIQWLPNISVNENKTVSFKIGNHVGNNINLFIEGTANDGSLISEVKTVNFN